MPQSSRETRRRGRSYSSSTRDEALRSEVRADVIGGLRPTAFVKSP